MIIRKFEFENVTKDFVSNKQTNKNEKSME
jgi:hypothetical protein